MCFDHDWLVFWQGHVGTAKADLINLRYSVEIPPFSALWFVMKLEFALRALSEPLIPNG